MSALPRVETLQRDVWTEVRAPVSLSTSSGMDDWRSYPHLSGKDNWKLFMSSNAEEFAIFLRQYGIWIGECRVCHEAGRGVPSDFGSHVVGAAHFKEVYHHLPDCTSLSSARAHMWQRFEFSGGVIRFNHADGAIEMCNGFPLDEYSVKLAVAPAHGSDRGPPSSLAVVPSVGIANTELPRIDALEYDQAWQRFQDPVGRPTQNGGDWSTLSWLYSKNSWKTAIAPSARKVYRLLDSYGIYPDCLICPRGHGFEEHVPAEKHFRELVSRLPVGKPVIEIVQDFWQEWLLPGGALRFNHLHGAIEMFRGEGTPRMRPVMALSDKPDQGQSGPKESSPTVSKLCCWLWRAHVGSEVGSLESELASAGISLTQQVCCVCEQPTPEGFIHHLLSPSHVERLQQLAAAFGMSETGMRETGTVLRQEWQLPGNRCLAINHFPFNVERSASVDVATRAGVEPLQWTKVAQDGRVYWQCSALGLWFCEGDERWQLFTEPARGHYYWNTETGRWFYLSGEDMGIWN